MSSEILTLRPARLRDVGPIARMAREHIEHGLRWTWRAARVARTLARTDALGVVALIDDDPAGFCLASYGVDDVHILLLGVDPRFRRSGVGSGLVDWHLKCASVAGAQRVLLELRADNTAARRFYEALDFEVRGRIRRYYQGREDALRMVLELWEVGA